MQRSRYGHGFILPEASAVRAAEYGCAPGVQGLLEGATGGAWMWERPPRCPRGAVTAAPVVPRAAPPAARPLDPRLEGADLGLRAWLSAQARRGDASGTTEQPPMVRDDPAAMVAGHVLAAYLDAVPTGLTARLADWLTQHVAAAAGRGAERGGSGRSPCWLGLWMLAGC